MSLALSIGFMFISLKQSVNVVKFLNTTSLLSLFGFTAGGGTGAIVIIPLTSI